MVLLSVLPAGSSTSPPRNQASGVFQPCMWTPKSTICTQMYACVQPMQTCRYMHKRTKSGPCRCVCMFLRVGVYKPCWHALIGSTRPGRGEIGLETKGGGHRCAHGSLAEICCQVHSSIAQNMQTLRRQMRSENPSHSFPACFAASFCLGVACSCGPDGN